MGSWRRIIGRSDWPRIAASASATGSAARSSLLRNSMVGILRASRKFSSGASATARSADASATSSAASTPTAASSVSWRNSSEPGQSSAVKLSSM